MQTEEGPGYADVEARGPGARSDPRDIPTRLSGIKTSRIAAAAAGSAPSGGDGGGAPRRPRMPYYGGGDVLPRDELPSYGFRAGDESVDLPHPGIGATAGGGGGHGGGGSSTAAYGVGAHVGSWPAHGLGDEFVSGGRHVLYCGADIPMEQLEGAHWHHAARPKGFSPLQAAAGSSPRAQGHSTAGLLLPRHVSEPAGGQSRARAAAGGGGGSGSGGGGGGGEDRPVVHYAAAPGVDPDMVFRSFGRDRSDEPPSKRMTEGHQRQQRMAASGGDEMVEDEVVEVEADTPAGYHVAATVLHPADAHDPQEYVVAATAVMAPSSPQRMET